MIWVALAGWLAGWVLAARRATLDPGPGRRSRYAVRPLPVAAGTENRPPSVSVVIPARNEAQRLPRLLAALAADPPDEVLVVDDDSADGTGALALAAGATVVPSSPPAGWTGKAAACQAGAERATGDVVVFLDADTEPAPGFVRRLAGVASTVGGLVSVQPWHRVERPYEQLSAVPNVVAVLGAGTGAPGPAWWRRPVAFGPAVAVPRLAYLAAGGHSGAAADVVEDLALAAALHDAGLPVRALVDDGAGVRYRMYPEGLRSLVEGWGKNLSAGAGRAAPVRTALVGLWITAALWSIVHPVAYVAFAVQLFVLFRRAGGFHWLTAVLWPVPMVAFVLLFARSLRRRPATWRGREVPA